MQAIPYTDARNQLARLLDRVTREHQPVLITRRKGEPAVLIALADFEHWRATSTTCCAAPTRPAACSTPSTRSATAGTASRRTRRRTASTAPVRSREPASPG